MERRFWKWWWFGGKEKTRLMWHRVQVLLVVTFATWVIWQWWTK